MNAVIVDKALGIVETILKRLLSAEQQERAYELAVKKSNSKAIVLIREFLKDFEDHLDWIEDLIKEIEISDEADKRWSKIKRDFDKTHNKFIKYNRQ